MKPAFRANWHALAFALLVFGLVALPFLLGKNLLPPQAIYRTMPAGLCDTEWLYRQVHQTPGDVDVAFIGSSMMWNAIDVPTIQKELRAECGSDKNVVLLGHNVFGLDTDYFFLKDLLSKRHVRLAVVQMPMDRQKAWAHRLVENWITIDDCRNLKEAPVPVRLCTYSELLLSAPRKLLSLVRDDQAGQRINVTEERLGSLYCRDGWGGKEFQTFRPKPACDSVLYSSSPQSFAFDKRRIGPYQDVFLERTMALLNEHNVKVLVLHLPTLSESRDEHVKERFCWTQLFENTDILGVPPQSLFAGLSDEQKRRLFLMDIHLNANGSEYFSKAICQGVIREYKKTY